MKAIYISSFGDVDGLDVREVESPPPPEDGEVLVRVRAAGLNRADLLQRKGLYPAPKGYPERIPGLEFAGEISETGKNVEGFARGERVFGIIAGGAQAEFLVTKADQIVRIPDRLSFAEAAAVPEAFITAHDAVRTQGRLRDGETLLIHAVGSGVGLAALQIAKARRNHVIGTSRTREKLDACGEFGLDLAINTLVNPDFASGIEDRVDVILDLVGASGFEQNLRCLNRKGRLLLVGLIGGRKAEFDLGTALTKRLRIIGTVLRSRSAEEKALATAAFAEEVVPLIEKGKIRPNLDRVLPADGVRQAHEYLESNDSFGKVVLEF